MIRSLLVLLFCALCAGQSFDEGISKHFVPAADAKATAKSSGKPLMVLITEEWCGACKGLKTSVNSGKKGLLDSFVVTHVSGDESAAWKQEGHGYVPQTYFYSPEGEALKVEGPMEQYSKFYGNEDALAEGMEKALAAVGGGKKEL